MKEAARVVGESDLGSRRWWLLYLWSEQKGGSYGKTREEDLSLKTELSLV